MNIFASFLLETGLLCGLMTVPNLGSRARKNTKRPFVYVEVKFAVGVT